MDILPLFCEIDDFCKVFEKLWRNTCISQRQEVSESRERD